MKGYSMRARGDSQRRYNVERKHDSKINAGKVRLTKGITSNILWDLVRTMPPSYTAEKKLNVKFFDMQHLFDYRRVPSALRANGSP